MAVPCFYNMALLCSGVKHYHMVALDDRYPHMLIVGSSGSGKSYALTLVVGKFVLYEASTRLVICDYKKATFGWMGNQSGFYWHLSAVDGIKFVYAEMQRRIKLDNKDLNKQKIIIVIDEYASLVLALDKKSGEEVKRMVSELLMTGRSLGIQVIVAIQRADAEFFLHDAREQYNTMLMLGDLSKEQKNMLLPDYRESMNEHNSVGQGYLFVAGQGIARVQVPEVVNLEKLHSIIRERLVNTSPSADVGEA